MSLQLSSYTQISLYLNIAITEVETTHIQKHYPFKTWFDERDM